MVKEMRIIPVSLNEEMKHSYIDYAMSVIVGRALPDVRDGLKPAHRRVLYAMQERGWLYNKSYVKSAKIVGEVIGNYHPHGDIAVYDTIVRMVQDFSMRTTLIDGQGNFGSVDGDNAAAYRYTEARLSRVAESLMEDIKKDTVNFIANFDDSRMEPVVLPAAYPNLLINGTSGIAVGMATNIPPHNPNEIIDAAVKLIDNPGARISDLMKIIPGPDFPTGGVIFGYDGIKEAYSTGRGKIIVRARAVIEEGKGSKENIIITEIPYQVNKSNLIANIAKLVNERKIEGIVNIRDESDRNGMRIVVELRRNVNSEIILNQLFKHTQMQITFGIIMLALVENQPVTLNLKQILDNYIAHRKEVIERRTRFNLRKSEERAHILEGLRIALDEIDAIINLIRTSRTVETAKNSLKTKFKLSDIQAEAILDMRLQKLTGLEREKIESEHRELVELIKKLKALLSSGKKILEVVKEELLKVKEIIKDERRTKIVKEAKELQIEDIIVDEDMVITLSHDGFIKRLPITTYKRQRRGGRGVAGMGIRQEDFIEHITIASMLNYLFLFSNRGKVFWIKAHELPQEGRLSKGRSLRGLVNLSSDEKCTTTIPIKDVDKDLFILIITKKGIMKKISIKEFLNARKKGIIAQVLDKDDELKDAILLDENSDLLITTENGKALRIKHNKLKSLRRQSRGIIGIRLSGDDFVVGITLMKTECNLLVVTKHGYGKIVNFKNFSVKNRGGHGMIYFKMAGKNGKAVATLSIRKDDDFMILSQKGVIIRLKASEVPIQGRTSQGVRFINLDENDEVIDVAIVEVENNE